MADISHQDWDIEGADVEEVLDAFIAKDPHRIRGARDGAVELLARGLSEDELASYLETRQLGYAPEGRGMTHREWLELVAARLTDALELGGA